MALREVWPEGDVFGSVDVEPDEELEVLKKILQANLPRQWIHSGLLCLNTDAAY